MTISTHAPRTGSDIIERFNLPEITGFQPTLPARGATRGTNASVKSSRHFNPRSPHGERRTIDGWLHVETETFQPTLPARGATVEKLEARVTSLISTHAPRTGSDTGEYGIRLFRHDFNPRSPHGERPALALVKRHKRQDFNPRSPHGERPEGSVMEGCSETYFNPRSPHGERRPSARSGGHGSRFQPTLPARGATVADVVQSLCVDISTHAPRTGSDNRRKNHQRTGKISTHAPRTGSDSAKQQFC